MLVQQKQTFDEYSHKNVCDFSKVTLNENLLILFERCCKS